MIDNLRIFVEILRSRTASKQLAILERSIRNDQFQKGIEMLGNREMTIRLGGIYVLENLAQEHPENYLKQIIRMLAAFVRCPVYDEGNVGLEKSDEIDSLPFRGGVQEPREDVQEAIRVISNLNPNDSNLIRNESNLIRNETVGHDILDLSRSNLNNMVLNGMNFSRMKFDGAQMRETLLVSCDFTKASLARVNLTGANFTNTDISYADFAGAKGLSERQLDQACYDQACPPTLPSGLSVDHETATARWYELHSKKDNNDRESPA